MNATVKNYPYFLEDSCPVAWQSIAEENLHADYPLSEQEKTADNFAIRRYLETLWLPESFNPLSHLILSLRRIGPPDLGPGNENEHPLHALLEPLLLSTRAASDKYHTELVQILENGEGGGGPEECMMWYAWEHEKPESDDIDENAWRKQWLERLEHREAMIQILIGMLKLCLPGPNPSIRARGRVTKKKKRNEKPIETDEERLESFMDRLAVWQLTSSLDNSLTSSQGEGSSKGKAKSDRHWTQIFCEDVVDKLFKSEVPELCELLRSKVFPSDPFSDFGDSDDEVGTAEKGSRAGSRAPSKSRKVALQRESSVISFQRHRSRSLSVSLAQDEASQRANVVEPKRTLSREISMSLAFKEKAKPRPKTKAPGTMQQSKLKALPVKKDLGVTLIAETPAKRKHMDMLVDNQGAMDQSFRFRMGSAVPSPPPTSSSPGEILIEDTPLPARVLPKASFNPQKVDMFSPMSPLSPVEEKDEMTHAQPNKLKGSGKGLSASMQASRSTSRGSVASQDSWLDENVDESFTGSFGSPDVMLLGSDCDNMVPSSPLVALKARMGKPFGLKRLGSKMTTRLDGGGIEMETPTKKRVRRK